MTNEFRDRLALVTGAASGIGLATAHMLAEAGARLALVDADGPGLARAAGALGPAVATSAVGDVADERLWDGLAPAIEGVAFAVINAGVASGGPIRDLAFAEWRRVLSVNLDGAFLSLRAAMRGMAGGGAIVMMASASGMKAEPGVAAYGVSKAALIHLAKVAAREGAADGIRVNAIAPGGVDTPIWDGMDFFRDMASAAGGRDAALLAMAGEATPLGRFARADEIARQILFLLSDAAATITGATLVSDGGYTL